jgi:hypothetical protein
MNPRQRIEPTMGPVESAQHTAAAAPPERPERRANPSMPKGLVVIVSLLVVAGLVGTLMRFFVYEQYSALFGSGGQSLQWALWYPIVVGLLALVIGALTLDGNKLGWILLVVLLAYESVGAVQGLITARLMGAEPTFMNGETISPYTRHGGRLLLDLLVLTYLLRARVRAFFGLGLRFVLIFICGVAAVAVAVAALLYQVLLAELSV